MLNYKTTKRFDKDLKKLIRQGKPIEKLHSAMNLLINEEEIVIGFYSFIMLVQAML